MNIEYFISKRLITAKENKNVFSRPIIRVTISAIAISVAVMVISLSILFGFKQEIIKKITGFNTHIQMQTSYIDSAYDKNPILSNEDLMYHIIKKNDIENIDRVMYSFGLIKTDNEFLGITLKGVENDYNWDFLKQHIIKGVHLNETICLDTPDQEWCAGILISSNTASKLQKDLGQKLRIYFPHNRRDIVPRTFIISGIYNTGMQEIDNNFAIVDLNKLMQIDLLDNDPNLNNEVILPNSFIHEERVRERFEITLSDFANLDESTKSIRRSLDSMSFVMKDPYNTVIQSIKEIKEYIDIFPWLDLQNINVRVIIILMLLVSGFNVISSILILILERTKLIGILKALGSSNWSIRKIFLYNSMYLAYKGLLWGNLIAFALLFIQYQFNIITLDEQVYYMKTIPVSFDIFSILLLNLGTLILCLLMMIIPSIVITKISSIKAIRFE